MAERQPIDMGFLSLPSEIVEEVNDAAAAQRYMYQMLSMAARSALDDWRGRGDADLEGPALDLIERICDTQMRLFPEIRMERRCHRPNCLDDCVDRRLPPTHIRITALSEPFRLESDADIDRGTTSA